ncbi:isoprenylcysteine carboxyl methyltransferase family protein [Pseudalkalibacillus berkeleyi]|uniref:15-methylpalmitoyl-4-hydroxy-2-pyrone 4-O-methyltransferase n=1 Tax=Pseudalkalibacillus berkeleyi TaxID=1069813 RepID=A0ABS9H1B8_9BACL|nr:isoprenylcysteine carboxylmethyltransferase family protein [Pseudalkalibacillus berkeleyi]MCF6137628.1 hypothetical protein [Pseudalkalibacillus berkeleyi]
MDELNNGEVNGLVFAFIFIFLIIQRLVELLVARRNETIMKEKGAKEYGSKHYKLIVILHTGFLISLWIEVYYREFDLSLYFPILFIMFLLLQVLRVWTIRSLGYFWNTKIIILPGANVIKKGPFQYLRHPNYVIVAMELFVIPLMFNAFFTAFVFSLFNAILIRFVRIPAEEKALIQNANYQSAFSQTHRFMPSNPKPNKN